MNPTDDELAQESFNSDNFVAKIAWQATADELIDPNKFDAQVLLKAFKAKHEELQSIKDYSQKRCDRLEELYKDEERRHCATIRNSKEKLRKSINTFHALQNQFGLTSNKIRNLGEQLELINKPRAQFVEEYKLVKQFADIIKPDYDPNLALTSVNSPSFFEDANITHKLYLISQEFPKSELYDKAKYRIEKKFHDIERELIEEFVKAYRNDNRSYMRDIASLMSSFQGYNRCIDAFIELSLVGVIIGNLSFDQREGFAEILSLCEKVQTVVKEVFKNPDEVMSKFLLNVYTGKLKDFIVESLKIRDEDKYLQELHCLYRRTIKLSEQIVDLKIGIKDLDFLTRRIFADYLNNYFQMEITSLKEKCSNILNRFYESKNHEKKATSSVQDFKSKIRSKNLNISRLANINVNIGQLANINISVANEVLPPGETLLSEEVAINILHDIKSSLIRSQDLAKPNEADCAMEILDVQMQYLCLGHLGYAIELGLNCITPTDLRFLDIMSQSNSIWHLIEKQFTDLFQPLLSKFGPKKGYIECAERKRDIMMQLETKLNEGFERTLSQSINFIRTTLNNEQKKSDFKPETEDITYELSTTAACTKVCIFVDIIREKILECLDGENVNQGYNEFGNRFYKTIYDHLQKFEFNSIGAMVAITDVKAYSSVIKIHNRTSLSNTKNLINDKAIDDQFDILLKLCNLWVVAPENLKENLEQQLSSVPDKDKSDMQEKLAVFAALRSDNRTNRVSTILNSLMNSVDMH